MFIIFKQMFMTEKSNVHIFKICVLQKKSVHVFLQKSNVHIFQNKMVICMKKIIFMTKKISTHVLKINIHVIVLEGNKT